MRNDGDALASTPEDAEVEDEYDEKGNLKPPSGEVMGGRVALWLLTELGYVESESKEEEGMENGNGDAKMDDAEKGGDDDKSRRSIRIDPRFHLAHHQLRRDVVVAR